MDINGAAAAVERFLQGYQGRGGRRATEVQAHPSGDDMNAIKAWVNLGPEAEGEDLHAWCADAEKAVRGAVDLEGVTIELRADAM